MLLGRVLPFAGALDGFTQTAAQSSPGAGKSEQAEASSQSSGARDGEGKAGPSSEPSKGGDLGKSRAWVCLRWARRRVEASSKSRASTSSRPKGASGEGNSSSSSDRSRLKSSDQKGPALTDTLEQLAQRTRQTVEGMKAPEPVPEVRGGRAAGEGEEAMGEEEEMMEKLAKQFEDMGTGVLNHFSFHLRCMKPGLYGSCSWTATTLVVSDSFAVSEEYESNGFASEPSQCCSPLNLQPCCLEGAWPVV